MISLFKYALNIVCLTLVTHLNTYYIYQNREISVFSSLISWKFCQWYTLLCSYFQLWILFLYFRHQTCDCCLCKEDKFLSTLILMEYILQCWRASAGYYSRTSISIQVGWFILILLCKRSTTSHQHINLTYEKHFVLIDKDCI